MLSVLAGMIVLAVIVFRSSPSATAEPKQKQMNKGVTPLMVAAGEGKLRVVEKLLRDGAQVNAADSDGITALHYAATGRDLKVVQALLRAGADINARTKANGTPLMSSLGSPYSSKEIALALINAGADVNIVDTDGETALWIATTDSSDEVVDTLLKMGASPNVQAEGGNTPLHMAALNGFVEKVKLLLKYGANPAIRDASGKTPLDVANPKWPEIARLLKERSQRGK